MVALAVGKTYLTAGGYVVEIINDELHSSERTAPGVTALCKRTCLEINKDPTNTCKDGWYYEPDGTVNALTTEWTEKLKIVEELPFPIPELPSGYEWADGYPQFREIKKDEYYVSNSYHENPSNKKFLIHYYSDCSPSIDSKFRKRRFAVVKATPTPEPTKDTDSLIAKYGEPEAGWRWLASDEKAQEGDEFKSPSLGYFVKSDNWRRDNNKKQGLNLQPYRRRIKTATALSKEYIEMHNYVDFPRYYKHRDNAFVENIKYIKRAGEKERHTIKKDGSIENNGNVWCSNYDFYVKEGIWVEVPAAEVESFVASIHRQKIEEENKVVKFPLYYQHKGGFNGDTKYVKKINESQYTVILKKDGKEVENEMYKWDKQRDQTVAEGTWVEVPEAEVNRFIASFKGPEESKQVNFPVYYKHKKGFSCDTKYVKRTSKEYYSIINNKGLTSSFIRPWTNINDKIISKEDALWIEVPESEVLDFIASVTVTEANSTLVKKEEEIEMKKETLVKAATSSARFAGNWGFKLVNYFFLETAANIARPILRGARYAVFLGSLSAAVYGYNHPEVVKNAIKSCIPKITIEAPEVLKG